MPLRARNIKTTTPTLFETESPWFDADKTRIKGKIFELTRDTNQNGRIDIDDLEWHYLEGDGDFRSKEVCKLRDEADIIVTNPPFSLFREFLGWIMVARKQFLVIGNKNAIGYKEVFPLIQDNKIWYGPSITSGDREFMVPKDYDTHSQSLRVDSIGNKYIRVPGVHWFTNLEHGRRHEPLQLMSMKDNLRFGRHKEIRQDGYQHYVNYDAIEVPYSDAIPDDYEGAMGVPISFLDKYCPEQFEIIGHSLQLADMSIIKKRLGKAGGGPRFYIEKDGELVRLYERIIIRKKQQS